MLCSGCQPTGWYGHRGSRTQGPLGYSHGTVPSFVVLIIDVFVVYYKQPVDIFEGITDKQADRMAKVLGFSGPALEDAKTQMKNLYKMFIARDATQVEINPFVLATNGLGLRFFLLPALPCLT